MKTVGLLSLCVQAGLHIPAASESEFPIFEDILVDIGDEQSIENDLSTFSSHLIRLKEILVRASERTLVLLDEIGAGTDPAEGGALAAVVLEALTARRALTIATTHHGTLKAFAHETPGMANASLEFDQRSLRPTYRFRMGIPGSSYALELAERIGLSKQLIAKARVHLGEERSRLEHLLLQLELKTQEYERQLSESTRERLQLQQLLATYEERLAELRKEVQVIKKKAKDEANEILLLARATVERVVKEIREQAASSYAVRSAKEQLRSLREELKTRDMQVSETRTDHEPLQKGDQVRLKGGTEIGEVQELRKHDATVVWKHGTLKVRRTELEKVDQEEKTSSLTPSRGGYNPQPKAEIDLRGMYGDEAVQVVQRILDEAVVANLHRVDIIHGKGTGALRKRVTEFLKTSPVVKSFRLGEWNEGGSGVTVVELGD
jgi:DNA mismatch repair protein MutS2